MTIARTSETFQPQNFCAGECRMKLKMRLLMAQCKRVRNPLNAYVFLSKPEAVIT